MVKKRWDELTHSSTRSYSFRQKYIMGPFHKLASFSPWYDQNAVLRFQEQLGETYREWLAGSTVLEIGCGPGYLSRDCMETYGSKLYIGADYSVGMVKDAKSQYGNFNFVYFINADTFSLPFADNSFDVVLSIALFHHLKPEMRGQAIREQSRVARRALITIDPFGFEPGFWCYPYRIYYTWADGSYYRYTRREWLAMFRSLNIKVVKIIHTSEHTILHRMICLVSLAGEEGDHETVE